MRSGITTLFLFALVASRAAANSGGAPALRTGAAVDGGITCNACHRGDPPNSDQRGRIAIDAASYRPGVRQTIRVTVEHPDAARWGFQLTARTAANELLPAGTFTADDRIRVRCAPAGANAPCNGEREFASHTAATTTLGTNGRMTWDVEWTPPAQDAGDIVLYAAGNAADRSLNSAGDLIYMTAAVLRNADGCALPGAPELRAITNAASGQPNLALNGLATIYGVNFAPAGRSRSTTQAERNPGRFPQSLNCVTVLVNNNRVPVTFAGPDQINIQAPSIGLQNVNVQVVANAGLASERRGNTVSTLIQLVQPAFFKFGTTNSIAARFADGVPVAMPAVVPGGRPARAGDVISLFATGLGVTQPFWAPGDLPAAVAPIESAVTVTVGGITLGASDVIYAGLAPGSISGLYQINVRVPMNLGAGDQPVRMRLAGVESAAGTTIPIGQ
jgi:uncharacterized protein (TIGR03437 family)